MDAKTRRTLAGALKDATVETLREDARDYAGAADAIEAVYVDHGDVVPPEARAQVDAHRRMAALAMAVAMMQERERGRRGAPEAKP